MSRTPSTTTMNSETFPVYTLQALQVQDDLQRAGAPPQQVLESLVAWLDATAGGLSGSGRTMEASVASSLAAEVLDWRDDIEDAASSANDDAGIREEMRGLCLRWGV